MMGVKPDAAHSVENDQHTEWPPAPGILALESDEVHLWRATLDKRAALVESLWQTLAADE
jgi:hypothetical protein